MSYNDNQHSHTPSHRNRSDYTPTDLNQQNTPNPHSHDGYQNGEYNGQFGAYNFDGEGEGEGEGGDYFYQQGQFSDQTAQSRGYNDENDDNGNDDQAGNADMTDHGSEYQDENEDGEYALPTGQNSEYYDGQGGQTPGNISQTDGEDVVNEMNDDDSEYQEEDGSDNTDLAEDHQSGSLKGYRSIEGLKMNPNFFADDQSVPGTPSHMSHFHPGQSSQQQTPQHGSLLTPRTLTFKRSGTKSTAPATNTLQQFQSMPTTQQYQQSALLTPQSTLNTPSLTTQQSQKSQQKTTKDSKSKSSKKKSKTSTATATTSTSTSGGGYSRKSGNKTRNGPKQWVTYDSSDLSKPLPDDLECTCFMGNKHLSVSIFGKRLIQDLNPTELRVLLENQSSPINTIPKPFPPETIPYDYASHPWVYYVHFNRWDRRLEQWVTRDRIRLYEELVRFFKPYSLQPDATGAQCATNGLLVEYNVLKVLHPRFLGMRSFSPQQQHEIHQLNITQPNSIPPLQSFYLNATPSVFKQHQYMYLSQLTGQDYTTLPPTPQSNLQQPDGSYSAPRFLIPFIIPSPLPIVSVLPPAVGLVKKNMENFELQYEQAAMYTFSLIMNTPLQSPPSTSTVTTAAPATTTAKARRASNARPPAASTTTTTTPATSTSQQQSNLNNSNAVEGKSAEAEGFGPIEITAFPDGWTGPSPAVELVEDALLHYGPDLEEEEHINSNRFKTVTKLHLGPYELTPWYFSPYPEEYLHSGTLWLCDFCLQPFAYEPELHRHQQRCTMRHPPGQEIYRSSESNVEISLFEVDGATEPYFCQNLAYLAKLFLDHKTLWSDTSIFLFYVLCEVTPRGMMLLGFFSKEKEWTTNNLACILTLPQYQGKGYGKFLISMSYELSKLEKRIGGPEHPLSDLGRISYIAYWTECSIKVINHAIGVYFEQCAKSKRIFDETLFFGPIPGLASDLAFACNNIISCPDHVLSSIPLSLQKISHLTWINVADLDIALKERSIISFSKATNEWVWNWTKIKQVAQSTVKKYQDKVAGTALMSPEKRAQQQACRYAVGSLIRWSSYKLNPETNQQLVLKRPDFDTAYGYGQSHHYTRGVIPPTSSSSYHPQSTQQPGPIQSTLPTVAQAPPQIVSQPRSLPPQPMLSPPALQAQPSIKRTPSRHGKGK